MHILVCGSRDWTDRLTIGRALYACKRKYGDFWLVHGNCRGADKLAGYVALNDMELPVIAVPAMWEKNGKAAGPIRNKYMIDHCHPDLVLAFHKDYLNSKGTRDMIRKADEARIDFIVVRGPDDIDTLIEKLP